MNKMVAEREINIMDMFWAICQKWRQLLAGAVIMALLAGGFSYLKGVQETKKSFEPVQELTTEDMELEEDSKQEAIAYFEYKQLYDTQKEYNDNAALMKLDASGFYRTVITYYVDNHFTVEYPLMSKTNNIHAILEAYRAVLREEDFADKLKEATGCDEAELAYKKELIDCDNQYGELNKLTNETGILRISVYSDNEEECRAIAELVKESLQAGRTEIASKMGEHDITLLGDECDFVSDSNLLKYQQDNISRLSGFVTNSTNLKSKMTDEEIAFADAYEKEQVADGVAEKKEQAVTASVSISKKLVVLGFVGGAALIFCIYAVMYLLNNKLCLEDDFERLYPVMLLGNIILANKKKKKWFGFVDKLFAKMRHLNRRYFEEDEAISMTAAGIKIAAKKRKTDTVYVTGATIGAVEKQLIGKLKEELKGTDIDIIEGKPILYDAEALEQSAESGFLVLLEQAGVSLYDEIAQEIEVCNNQGMEILGAIVIAS